MRLILLCSIFILASCSPQKQQITLPSHVHFFNSISSLNGNSYKGKTITELKEDDSFFEKPLYMTVIQQSDSLIHIPFIVGTDSSRTWIFKLTENGLLFKHRHVLPDGSLDPITNYGGWNDSLGTNTTQNFPADSETASLIPAAATNMWSLSLDTKAGEFLYLLSRNNTERYRAKFFLK